MLHRKPSSQHVFGLTVALMTLILAPLCAGAAMKNMPKQAHEEILQSVERFIKNQLSDEQLSNSDVTLGRLDPRLRLNACNVPLQAFLPPGTTLHGRALVGVRCNKGTHWKIFVPVTIQVFRDILVTTESVRRGQILEAHAIRSERRDITKMNNGYLSNPQKAVGQIIKHSLRAGTALTPSHLRQPHWVKRGDQVIIIAKIAGIEIRTKGKALNAAGPGEHIKVRNNKSKRVVEAYVVKRGVVEVPM